jgi:hypothetical protein
MTHARMLGKVTRGVKACAKGLREVTEGMRHVQEGLRSHEDGLRREGNTCRAPVPLMLKTLGNVWVRGKLGTPVKPEGNPGQGRLVNLQRFV